MSAGNSTYTAIVTALKESLLAILYSESKTIGNVYDYERWCRDPKQLNALFGVASETGIGKVLVYGWMFSRTSTEEIREEAGINHRHYKFTIRGFMSVDDAAASEKIFQGKVEAISDRFRKYPDIQSTDYGGSGQPGDYPVGVAFITEPPRVVRVEAIDYAGVMCHYTEIEIIVEELITSK